MEFLHAVHLFVMHIDVTAITNERSASPVQVSAAPATVTKSAVATKPTLAPKPKEDDHQSVVKCDVSAVATKPTLAPKPKEDDHQSVVKCDTTIQQADVG